MSTHQVGIMGPNGSGPTARFAMLRAGDIHIDLSYQRAAQQDRVTRMAARWHASAPIEVSERTDGSGFYVYNGQHRLLAFRIARGHDEEIPSWIEALDREEEARRFAYQYQDTTRVDSPAILRALVSIDDEHAVGMNDLIHKYGLVPGQSLMGLTTFGRLYATDPLIAELVLDYMKAAWGEWTASTGPTTALYAGLFAILTYHANDVERDRMVWALSRMPPRTLAVRALGRSPGVLKLRERDAYATIIELYNGPLKPGSRPRITPRTDLPAFSSRAHGRPLI